MNEIELKARVYDRQKLIDALNSFAVYKDHVVREDEYYCNPKLSKKKIRIRYETGDKNSAVYLTYKKKEVKTDENGFQIEVNDEKECTVSSAEPLKVYLEDIGFTVALKKHKDVMYWAYEDAVFELCSVPPLGDFLEIEIQSESSDEKTVDELHKKLEVYLGKTGLDKSCIETKFYSQLLAEYEQEKRKNIDV